MSTYTVFEHKVFGKKAVKNGFSAGGCFLTGIWALYHKMWPLACILYIWASIAYGMNAVLSNIDKGSISGAMFSQFLFYHLPGALIFGFMGNGILKSRLKNQGYEQVAEVEALSVEDALAKTAPSSQPTSASQPPSGLAEQLAKLNDLRQQGALSDDEYQAAKAKLL
jgi:hypothetical protein